MTTWKTVLYTCLKKQCSSYYFLCLGALALFCAAASVVSAQTTTASTSSNTAEVDEPPAIFESEASAQIPVVPISLSDRGQTRVINLAANISNYLEATIARLEHIAKRAERRATILADTQDISTVTTALAETDATLSEATKQLLDIDSTIVAVATAENPAAAWPVAKTQYTNAAALIAEAKSSLQSAVTALAKPPVPVAASSTEDSQE